ncbi:MAG: alpha/beta hydrolase [Caldilineaceae bacterium]
MRNADIYDQAWLPDGEVKAVIPIVHGIGEHSGRYTNHVNYQPHACRLRAGPFGARANRTGSGRSSSASANYTDTLEFQRHGQGSRSRAAVFILGHSSGGLITSTHSLDHQDEFQGAILSALASSPAAYISGATIAVGKVISASCPSWACWRDMKHLAIRQSLSQRPAGLPGQDAGALGAEMLSAMRRGPPTPRRPSLCPSSSSRAPATRWSIPAVRNCSTTRSVPRTNPKLYDGLYHELHNEPERDTVFADVIAVGGTFAGPRMSALT